MISFNLTIEQCPIINIDNEYYVIDNGVPYSFSYVSEREIEIEGTKYHLKKDSILSTLFNTFKTKISGVIGMDIIKNYNGITIDIQNHKFYFDSIPNNGKQLKMDNFLIDIVVDDTKVQAIIDLVSKDTYCVKSYIKDNNEIGTIQMDTLAGKIDFCIYQATVEALSREVKTNVLIIPNSLYDQTKISAIINPLNFVNNYISLNFKDKTISFE